MSPLLLPQMISEAPAKLVCLTVMTKKRRKMVLLLLCIMERSPTSASMVIKGFGGSRMTNVKSGTLRWKWEDDLGVTNTFLIPNSYYIPDGHVRLLSHNIGRKPRHKIASLSQNMGRQQMCETVFCIGMAVKIVAPSN